MTGEYDVEEDLGEIPDHAPIGTTVRIVTGTEAGHSFPPGSTGEVVGYSWPWAVVRVACPSSECPVGDYTQVLDPDDYEAIS